MREFATERGSAKGKYREFWGKPGKLNPAESGVGKTFLST